MNYRINVPAGIVALLVLTFGAGPEAVAHHSFAMFDKAKYLTVKGVVRKLEWSNPHTYLYLEVPKKNGAGDFWIIECSSPNELSHWGWHYGTVKVGDTVTVGMFPLRNGQRGGLVYSVTLTNGVVLKAN